MVGVVDGTQQLGNGVVDRFGRIDAGKMVVRRIVADRRQAVKLAHPDAFVDDVIAVRLDERRAERFLGVAAAGKSRIERTPRARRTGRPQAGLDVQFGEFLLNRFEAAENRPG